MRSRPDGMTIGVHMCRGNAMGRWIAAGSYEAIAERTFNSLEVDAYFLEYDTERAGGFEPLPQCGFASHRKGTALTFAEQEAKLELVVETATDMRGKP